MLLIACLLTTVICSAYAATLVSQLGSRSGEFAFFASYGLIFGVAPIMQSTESYAYEFAYEYRVQAAWYGLSGLMMLLSGFAFVRRSGQDFAASRKKLSETLALPHSQIFLKRIFWCSIAITAGAQLLMMYAKGITLLEVLNAGRFTYRFNNTGVLTVLSSHLTSFVYAPAFVGVFLSRRYQALTLAYLPLASVVFFFVFAKGTRSIPLALITTTLIAASLRYQVSPRRFVYAMLAGGTALMLAVGLFELRQQQDTVSFWKGAAIMLDPGTYSGMWDRDPLGYSVNLVGAMSVFPEHHPFLDAATYRRMPVFFLPEASFPTVKPPDTNVVFGLVVHGRDEDLRVTSPPSILGDIFINFWGWKGLPLLAVHGALYGWLMRQMQVSVWGFLWIGPMIGRFLVLIHRGEPYEMFVLFVMFFMTTWIVRKACSAGLPKLTTNTRVVQEGAVKDFPRAPSHLSHGSYRAKATRTTIVTTSNK